MHRESSDLADNIELSAEDMRHLIRIARFTVVLMFVLVAIMLFHVLVDFFYHT